MKTFVIGAGGWGTALAMVLEKNGHQVSLWEYDKAYANEVRESRENSRFLKGVKLPDGLEIVTDFMDLESAELVLLVTPSAHLRATLARCLDEINKDQVLVIATKGVERGSLMTMSQVAEEVFRDAKKDAPYLASLSGPSHAEEVARRVPTTVVAAAEGKAAEVVQKAFNNDLFRVYTTSDHLGVEIAGSLKNVIAVAAGIADGLGLGDNSKAALMTRGLAEISRLGVEMGADQNTFAGLAGMGDLVVTCMSKHSRNRGVGERLGKGESLSEIQAGMAMVAEGVVTAESALGLAKKYNVDMPICQAVGEILFQGKDARQALVDLMTREPKSEEV